MDIDLANTILFLRPLNDKSNEVVELPQNASYRVDLSFQSESKLFDLEWDATPPTSPKTDSSNRRTREETPGFYSFTKVLRLSFPTPRPNIEDENNAGDQDLSRKYFQFGCHGSHVYVPSRKKKNGSLVTAWFRIRYDFDSGALVIEALTTIMVGVTKLEKNSTTLLMAGASINCADSFNFAVEFPDLSSCLREHENNFLLYASSVERPGATYVPSSTTTTPFVPIGNGYKRVAEIGAGENSIVYSAIRNEDGQKFAIKMLRGSEKKHLSRDEEQKIRAEVELKHNLRHPNIIEYSLSFRDKRTNQVCIVMEHAVSDLARLIEVRKHGSRPYLSMDCIRTICWQALAALKYMHSTGHTHRNLRPENIMVANWDTQQDMATIRLGGLGHVHTLVDDPLLRGRILRSPGYEPPEVVRAISEINLNGATLQLLDYKAIDIWALGQIIEELMLKHKEPEGRALNLVAMMKSDDPRERPSASDCLEYDWMISHIRPNNLPSLKRVRSTSVETESSSSSSQQPSRNAARRVLYQSVEEDVPDFLHSSNAGTSANYAQPSASSFAQPSRPFVQYRQPLTRTNAEPRESANNGQSSSNYRRPLTRTNAEPRESANNGPSSANYRQSLTRTNAPLVRPYEYYGQPSPNPFIQVSTQSEDTFQTSMSGMGDQFGYQSDLPDVQQMSFEDNSNNWQDPTFDFNDGNEAAPDGYGYGYGYGPHWT